MDAHTHACTHACACLGSTVSSLLVHVFPTSVEDGTVAVTEPPASRDLPLLQWLAVHVLPGTQRNTPVHVGLVHSPL